MTDNIADPHIPGEFKWDDQGIGGIEQRPLSLVRFISKARITGIVEDNNEKILEGVLHGSEPGALVYVFDDTKDAIKHESNRKKDSLNISDMVDVEVRRKIGASAYAGVVLTDTYPLYAEEASHSFDFNEKVFRARVAFMGDKGSPIIRGYTDNFHMEYGYLIIVRSTQGFKKAVHKDILDSANLGRYVFVQKTMSENVRSMGFYQPVVVFNESMDLHKDRKALVTYYEEDYVYNLPLIKPSRNGDLASGMICLKDGYQRGKFLPVAVHGTTPDDVGSVVDAIVTNKRDRVWFAEKA